MKRQNLKRIITMGLIAASLIIVAPMKANAEWKQDNTGWWYTEGSSYATGWRNISGQWYYFTDNGYMKTGWIKDNNDWYYLYNDGSMAANTFVDNYYVGFDGAWIPYYFTSLRAPYQFTSLFENIIILLI